VCEIEENYNLNLALHVMTEKNHQDLRDVVVRNKVMFGPQGCVIILTGPNLGGKTTYIQAIGLTHILAQAGLYVPGTKARISPVDNIYTHFPTEEHFEEGTGRLGDEVKRFHEMFAQATRHSLILLNESLSSTSPVESLYLAEDIVRILRLMGARTIFATHLHELAARVDTLNSETSGDNRIISMVASLFPEEDIANTSSDLAHKRSYKVVPSPPMRSSYAKEIARQYGVSFEQLWMMLRDRGVLDTDPLDTE
jgi:DNA mismatch repair ATPase MutS